MLLFKAFEQNRVNTFNAIVINYWTCVLMGLIVLQGNIELPNALPIWEQTWIGFALFLGAIFIGGFYLIALTTQQNGVTTATIASKMSLVLPVIAAVFLYNDSIGWSKIVGIILAISAIFLTAIKQKTTQNTSENTPLNTSFNYALVILPVSIFFIGGTIEIILKYVQEYYTSSDAENAVFTMSLFGIAAIIGTIVLVLKRRIMPLKDAIAGLILGIPNYFSIYFLLLALQYAGWESSVVFPVNNIGIVSLSAVGALVIFGEQLQRINVLGLCCAVLAIILMTL